MKKKLLLLSIILQLSGSFAAHVHAQTSPDLSVTPVVIDEKAKPRDILKETVMVKNNSNHVLELYPSVTDINSQVGNEGFTRAADSLALSDSLANWIELSRGEIQLGPGEEKAVPFIIRVNLNAVPTTYHAQISLTEGVTRAEADSKPALGVITVNVEVQADIKELLQLSKFSTGSVFLSGDDVMFNYQLQNIGNQDLEPKGQVHIYNRNGAEVATVDVNKEGKVVSPDQVAQLASVWTAANGFGRYKALLTINYGSSQTATVQDTAFFWVVPWKQMAIMFGISLIIVVFLAFQFHNWLERRHLYKFAHAGLLNEDTIQKLHRSEPSVSPVPVTQPQTQLLAPPLEPKLLEAKKSRLRPRFFKRKATEVRTEVDDLPAPLEPTPHKSLKEVLSMNESPKHGVAIDLKQLRTQAKPQKIEPAVKVLSSTTVAEVRGNVISLKKNK